MKLEIITTHHIGPYRQRDVMKSDKGTLYRRVAITVDRSGAFEELLENPWWQHLTCSCHYDGWVNVMEEHEVEALEHEFQQLIQ